jgi:hypothetical protein
LILSFWRHLKDVGKGVVIVGALSRLICVKECGCYRSAVNRKLRGWQTAQ